MDALPRLDRDAYRARLRAELEAVIEEVAEAVDGAASGSVIRQSEEAARRALDRFRRVAYETAIQMKVDAAEAAFPPSTQRGDGKASAS